MGDIVAGTLGRFTKKARIKKQTCSYIFENRPRLGVSPAQFMLTAKLDLKVINRAVPINVFIYVTLNKGLPLLSFLLRHGMTTLNEI